MPTIFDEFVAQFGGYLPTAIGALAVLIVGWLVALLAGALVRGVLHRTELDNKLARWIFGEEGAERVEIERWGGRIVYYLILVFVLIAFLQILGLRVITQPLNEFLVGVFGYAPRLFGALALVLVAWVIASILRLVVRRALAATKWEENLSSQAGIEEGERVPLTQTLGDAVYWLVLLMFLPAVLSALALQGLLEPVQGLVDQILGYLPNLVGAALILLVGWFVARILQRILTNLLAAAGVDGLSERVGLTTVLGEQRLSGLLGLIAYILIFIPVLVAALNALAAEAITRPASDMLSAILAALPAIFAAALLLTVVYVAGRIVAGFASNLLAGIGFNSILVRLGLGKEPEEGERTPSEVAGYLVLVVVMLFATIEAARLLGFELFASLVSRFTVFAGHVGLGLIIFAIGLYLGSLAANAIRSSKLTQAGLLATAAQVAVVVLAAAMGLRQAGVANEIINLAFGILLGAIAVAVALAFGLGGRDIAARELDGWMRSIRSEEEKK